MSIQRISDPHDSRLEAYHGVPEPELVRARGLFVAEGRLVVRRLIEDARYTVHSLLVSDAALRGLESSLAALPADVPVYVCERAGFLDITGHDLHRGCLALAARPAPRPFDALLAPARAVVVLEGVADAGNIGGVFRNAAAFGAGAVLLSPTCCDPLYRKAVRTSMAATLRVPFARIDEWPAALSRVRTAGFTIVALTPREPAEELEAFRLRPRPEKLALLVGAEGTGLTPAAETMADYRVRVPIRTDVDSLNLAVAAGIALYRLST
jgi:tRNA G18 (ribose-2'-O)-methylase SpoU